MDSEGAYDSDEHDALSFNDQDIPITGFAVASSKRNADFHEVFPEIPDDDYLIEGIPSFKNIPVISCHLLRTPQIMVVPCRRRSSFKVGCTSRRTTWPFTQTSLVGSPTYVSRAYLLAWQEAPNIHI